MSSNVAHPAHYNQGKIEVIEFLEDKGLDFHLGNVVKYVARAGKKDPKKEIEDLEKASWYLKRKIELLRAGSEQRDPTRPNSMNPRESILSSSSATAASSSKIPEPPTATAKRVPLAFMTQNEIESGLDRLAYAENLILNMPLTNSSRAAWLLHYGLSEEACKLRKQRGLRLDPETRAAVLAVK